MKSFLFTESLFNQILAGNKTQTRRVIDIRCNHSCLDFSSFDNERQEAWFRYNSNVHIKKKSPKKVGDICYLKEPFYIESSEEKKPFTHYLFDHELPFYDFKFKNKLFMPESAARYFVKITKVRVERLQNISKKDAIAEGIKKGKSETNDPIYLLYGLPNKATTNLPILSFKTLWQSIHQNKNKWDYNPFVWVYDFDLIDKSEVYK